jgi:hypothetical protein
LSPCQNRRTPRSNLQVAVYGLGDADDADRLALRGEVFGEEGGVRVGIIASNDDERVEFVALGRGQGFGELLRRLDLRPARPDHVETTRIPIRIHEFCGYRQKFVVDQAALPAFEAHKVGFLGNLF